MSPERAEEELMREVERGWRRRDLVEALIGLSGADMLPRFRTLQPLSR